MSAIIRNSEKMEGRQISIGRNPFRRSLGFLLASTVFHSRPLRQQKKNDDEALANGF